MSTGRCSAEARLSTEAERGASVMDFAAMAMVTAIIGQSSHDRSKKLTGGLRPGASGRNRRQSEWWSGARGPEGRQTADKAACPIFQPAPGRFQPACEKWLRLRAPASRYWKA